MSPTISTNELVSAMHAEAIQPFLGQGRNNGGRTPAAFIYHDGSNPGNALSAVPPGLVHNTTGNYSGVGFTTRRLDNDNIWDRGSAPAFPSFFNIRQSGWYVLSAHAIWTPNAVGVRFAKFFIVPLTGATYSLSEVGYNNLGASSTPISLITPAINLLAGDRFQFQLFQNSGGNLALLTVAGTSPCISCVKVGN